MLHHPFLVRTDPPAARAARSFGPQAFASVVTIDRKDSTAHRIKREGGCAVGGNLRVLEVQEVKTVAYGPVSHPYVERLIGTIHREFLDHVLFWSLIDLEKKLGEFQRYFSNARVHALLGATPMQITAQSTQTIAQLDDFRWQSIVAASSSCPSPPDQEPETHRLARVTTYAGSSGRVAGMARNAGPACPGIGGRHALERWPAEPDPHLSTLANQARPFIRYLAQSNTAILRCLKLFSATPRTPRPVHLLDGPDSRP